MTLPTHVLHVPFLDGCSSYQAKHVLCSGVQLIQIQTHLSKNNLSVTILGCFQVLFMSVCYFFTSVWSVAVHPSCVSSVVLNFSPLDHCSEGLLQLSIYIFIISFYVFPLFFSLTLRCLKFDFLLCFCVISYLFTWVLSQQLLCTNFLLMYAFRIILSLDLLVFYVSTFVFPLSSVDFLPAS